LLEVCVFLRVKDYTILVFCSRFVYAVATPVLFESLLFPPTSPHPPFPPLVLVIAFRSPRRAGAPLLGVRWWLSPARSRVFLSWFLHPPTHSAVASTALGNFKSPGLLGSPNTPFFSPTDLYLITGLPFFFPTFPHSPFSPIPMPKSRRFSDSRRLSHFCRALSVHFLVMPVCLVPTAPHLSYPLPLIRYPFTAVLSSAGWLFRPPLRFLLRRSAIS